MSRKAVRILFAALMLLPFVVVVNALAQTSHANYLPLLYVRPKEPSRLGIHMKALEDDVFETQVSDGGPNSMVIMEMRWDLIEPTAPTGATPNETHLYEWSGCEGNQCYDYDHQVNLLDSKYDISRNLVIRVKNSPAWAREGTMPCSAPKQQYVDDFVEFVDTVVEKYHPYAVSIWNGPEAAWDNCESIFYGGFGGREARYASAVMGVFDAIQDTETLVVAGELEMGWTETNGNGHADRGDSWDLGFWSAVTQTLDPAKYDAIAIHAFQHCYPNSQGDSCGVVTDPGLVGVKARVLRGAPYAATKPLWVTQGALKMPAAYPPADWQSYREGQAKYMEETVNRLANWGIDYYFWYTLSNEGYNHSDLLIDGTPTTAYEKYIELTK
jgi:hypothetical protein